MARFQTSICINKSSLDKLKKTSSKSNINLSKIIQILLRIFFALNKKEQKNILKRHEQQSLINLDNEEDIKSLNVFINMDILRNELKFSSKINITRSILIDMLLAEFFELDEIGQINFLKQNKKILYKK